MRWMAVPTPQCLNCKGIVEVSGNDDWTKFTGECSCGKADITDWVSTLAFDVEAE